MRISTRLHRKRYGGEAMILRDEIARAMFAAAEDEKYSFDKTSLWLRGRYLVMADAAIATWNRVADPEPERHLTGQEQRIMDASLRRSVTIVEDPTP